MKISTSELSGKALDWAVAKCRGATEEWRQYGPFFWRNEPCIRVDGHDISYSPSDLWMLGGPIIEAERIHICPVIYNDSPYWQCWIDGQKSTDGYFGETPLTAAMRCYVASKMGESVEYEEGS